MEADLDLELVAHGSETDGLVRGARTNGLGQDDRWWHCPYCQHDIREQNLDDHLKKGRHIRNKVWVQQAPVAPSAVHRNDLTDEKQMVPQPALPAHWGDPRLYKYDPVYWKFRCLLCNRFADDQHVQSNGHQKWVPYAGNFIPALRQDGEPRVI